jgi:hypothetical protein
LSSATKSHQKMRFRREAILALIKIVARTMYLRLRDRERQATVQCSGILGDITARQ